MTSLEGFVKSQKNATKGVGAFDGPDRGALENTVLATGTTGLRFAPVSQEVIAANQSTYAKISGTTDALGKGMVYRLDAYNPLYHLSSYYQASTRATVAPNWRIRTGIMQGDTANTTEINLALALQNHGIRNVDFATVLGLGHTMAERTGDPATNFIAWVKRSVAG